MGRVRDFFKNLKKSKRGTSKFNSKKKAEPGVLEINKRRIEKINELNEAKRIYDEARKEYKENEPSSKKVYTVLYYLASKNPKIVKKIIEAEKDEKLKRELKRTFEKYL